MAPLPDGTGEGTNNKRANDNNSNNNGNNDSTNTNTNKPITGDTSAPTIAFYDDVNATRGQPGAGGGNGSGTGAGRGSDNGSDKDNNGEKPGGFLNIDWHKLYDQVVPNTDQPQPGGAQQPNPAAMEAFKKLREEVQERLSKGIQGQFEKTPQPKEDPWGGKSPEESITADAIDQGGIGDCYFESSLASLANTKKGKEIIKNMVTANDDGSFTIKFPGADEKVTVSKQDIADSGTTNREPWARAVETAFLKYNSESWHGWLASDGVGVFGKCRTMNDAIRLLTGDDVATTQFAFSDVGSTKLTLGSISEENVENQLKWAMQHGEVVTAGTSPHFAKWLGGNDSGNLPDSHAYSVLGYDEKTKTVTVRNPWGHNPEPLDKEGATVNGVTNAGDGKLTMSLDTFYHSFSDMSVEGRNDLYNTVENLVTDVTNTPKNVLEAGWDLLHGDVGGAGNHLVHAFGSYLHSQEDVLNGATNLFWDYLGYNVKHPWLNLIPGAAPLGFGIQEAKEIAPLVGEKIVDTGKAIVDTGKKVVDVGENIVETGVNVVTSPIKAVGDFFGL